MIVLSWINSSSNKWKTFVSNRVGEIQSLSRQCMWHHVASHDNPADICSRGLSPEEILNNDMWWHGPEWLRKDRESSTYSNFDIGDLKELPEARTMLTTMNSQSHDVESLVDYNRFSSWNKLVRTVALCKKFIKILRRREERNRIISSSDFEQAKESILRNVQELSFAEETARLLAGCEIQKNSKILSLAPFLDADKVLRVGGRLKLSDLTYETKHPALLPHDHHVTLLITRHEHLKNMHSGITLTLAAVRRAYWPIRARTIVKKVVRHCIICFKHRPICHQPIMGELPRNRIVPNRPFDQTGIDYAGPFFIKDGQQRNKRLVKAYLVLFICFTTKAIHLEITCDLTTQSFIGTLRRFISRRGKPSRITSDNATTFQGAKTEIQELYDLYDSNSLKEIEETLSCEGIEWKYIPPRSPNFGGLWEAGVKAFKHHFKRTVGETNLTYEEMLTVVIQIESILNSRPITPVNDDPNDFSALTPNHFLIGDVSASLADPDLSHLKSNQLGRWQRVQAMQQHFWSRWQREYLATLQRRDKWKHKEQFPIKKGDLVIIAEENVPTFRWRLGRVEELQTGLDGVHRVASIRTEKGVVSRAVNKLCSLPID